ncbi:hypothetical protein SEPCBS57363_005113 [Sporothrix epigloea]|uniref:Uncharacterized protein n=1 Tax=Sporothrix epigloea TaxID=1892477 RepID=A0ABP0DVT9_9PEZI
MTADDAHARGQPQNGRQPSTSSTSLPAIQPTAAAQREGFAQALAELSRGERAADKLERELHAFETKLEELLSSMGMTEAELDAMEDVCDDGDADAGDGDGDGEEDDRTPGREGNASSTATHDCSLANDTKA